MKTLKDLQFTPYFDGISALLPLDNGLTLHIMRHSRSYGGDKGLYELAVLVGGKVYFDSIVDGGIAGNLNEQSLNKLINKLEKQPSI